MGVSHQFSIPSLSKNSAAQVVVVGLLQFSSSCSHAPSPPALVAHQIALNFHTCRLADAVQSCVGVTQESFAPVDHRMIHCLLHLVFSSPSYPCFPDLFRPCCRLCLFPITAQINPSTCFRFFFVSIRDFSGLDRTLEFSLQERGGVLADR